MTLKTLTDTDCMACPTSDLVFIPTNETLAGMVTNLVCEYSREHNIIPSTLYMSRDYYVIMRGYPQMRNVPATGAGVEFMGMVVVVVEGTAYLRVHA